MKLFAYLVIFGMIALISHPAKAETWCSTECFNNGQQDFCQTTCNSNENPQ